MERKQIRLDDAEVRDLCGLYRDGQTAAELAVQFGVHRSTVYALLQRSGVPRRAHVRKLTDKDVLLAIDRYRLDMLSLRKIGRQFGVDSETVRKELVQAGVQIRSPGRQNSG